MMNRKEKALKNFTMEAENFFVTKFLAGNALKKTYSDCLDIIFNLTGDMDSGRGIFAHNPRYGQGKSFFFDVVQHRFRRMYGRNLFFKVTAKQLCKIYKNAPKDSNPEDELEKFIKVKVLFIDDIGEELKDAKDGFTHHYNNKLNVIRWVLLRRYEFWTNPDNRWITHATTNLTLLEIGQHYDGRVADRVSQMMYFMEFDFLGSDQTFRQISETRMLKDDEIKAAWDRFRKQETEEEKVDLDKYFNELIGESDAYFSVKDFNFWLFVMRYLEPKGLIGEKNFKAIDNIRLKTSRILLSKEIREAKHNQFQGTLANVRKSMIERGLESIDDQMVLDHAKAMITKDVFMRLRNLKHKFE